jgi:hypothetical protein
MIVCPSFVYHSLNSKEVLARVEVMHPVSFPRLHERIIVRTTLTTHDRVEGVADTVAV